MATIRDLMPYLEQGYTAADHVRVGPAYLTPKKKDGTLVFEWRAYEMEGDWSGPEIHTKEHVLTWRSSNWGILCGGDGPEGEEDEPEKIERAIANGQGATPASEEPAGAKGE